MAKKINTNKLVTVFGAYGHTGKFVVAELVKRGYIPILSGRRLDKLNAIGVSYPELEIRPASIDDPNSLDNALEGAFAVINCAGPFLDTATPLVEAALRKRVHYLDMAAEQQCVLTTYERFTEKALDRGILIIPAMAFYGGLADLLATAAMGQWATADVIDIGVALDSWMPTLGTRLTGQRNTSRRLTFSNKTLVPVSDPLPSRKWQFSEPFGLQEVVGFPLTEIITISKHLNVDEINTYINLGPLKDIHNSDTPPPQAADDKGRSSQIFLMEVVVSSGGKLRKALAAGRDIYAITAPLIVEATIRIAEGVIKRSGVVCAAEVFDAADFLNSLSPEHLLIDIPIN
jgi:saccharopine dehydrogenase-like protein